MIAILKAINWRVLWQALKTAAALFGVAGLCAWFAVGWPWYALAASAVVVIAVVVGCYQIHLAIETRRRRREFAREHSRIGRRLRRRGQSWQQARDISSFDAALYRRRFVRFNPDTGEEEFKYELTQ
jgi:hypothetical protein